MTPKQTYEEIKRLREKERSFSKKISEIPWLEVARAADWACNAGIRQGQLAAEWGIRQDVLSRLLATLRLPPAILAFAERYNRSVFLELPSCHPAALKVVHELMEKDARLTCQMIRALAAPYRARKATRIHDLVEAHAKVTRHLKDFFRALPKGQAKVELRRIVAEIEREEAEAERLGRIA